MANFSTLIICRKRTLKGKTKMEIGYEIKSRTPKNATTLHKMNSIDMWQLTRHKNESRMLIHHFSEPSCKSPFLFLLVIYSFNKTGKIL